MALLEGTKVNLGGREFTVPPLNIKALRLLGPKFIELTRAADTGKLEDLFQTEKLDTLLEVIHAAMARNYPEITVAELEEIVDMGNLERIFKAVCSQSGLKQVPAGEGKGPRNK